MLNQEENNSSIGLRDNDAPAVKKLYALIVGICDYAEDILLTENHVRFPKLSGCVNDALNIRSYLEGLQGVDPEIVLLKDSEATRSNIIQQFKDHLGQAQAGDSMLFYFSGHGTRQSINPHLFNSEVNGSSEAIVAYYDGNQLSDALIADKEIRWLISKLNTPEADLLCIFDCCHSSGISRNAALVESSFKQVRSKRIPFIFPVRPYNEYIFSDEVPMALLAEKGEYEVLGNAAYVELSACESNESALEVAGEGIFTKELLRVLNLSEGLISYHDLISHIRQYLRGIYEQKPKLYTGPGSTVYFLGLQAGAKNDMFAELVFNTRTGWALNKGALQGLEIGMPVKVFALSDSKLVMDASISKVMLDTAKLSVNEGLNAQERYMARLNIEMPARLKLFVAGGNAPMATMGMVFDALSDKKGSGYSLTELEEEADICLRYLTGAFFLTYPDDPFRPLTIPIDLLDSHLSERLIEQLAQVSKWWFLKGLVNPRIPQNFSIPIKVEVDINDSGFNAFSGQELVVNYHQPIRALEASIRIRLTNIGASPIYCAAIFLSAQFAAYTGFLQPSVLMLEPGKSVELGNNGGAIIKVFPEETMFWYNLPFTKEFFQLIVSPSPFEIHGVDMNGIEPPWTPREEKGILIDDQLGNNRSNNSPVDQEWCSLRLPFKLLNPLHNTISHQDLEAMLKDERTADFALGLYFNTQLSADLAISCSVKPEIRLTGDRGIAGDTVLSLANWWARSSRNKLYQRNIKKFPDQIKMVSEGDSWFQHPLVFDIIDHLSRVYPIFCCAAAGDTFRNIVSGEHHRGEYYLEAIERIRPEIFLLSGGGNDILGSRFQEFLADAPDHSSPEAEHPARFLKASLLQEINDLMEIYAGLLGNLRRSYPKLKVILHGYDYPVKLNNPGKGWLGRYMIAKGIDREGDRRAIIHHIMDEFNTRLFRIAKENDNAVYLDLRKIIRYDPVLGTDQWYDEIHPNNEGFQQIAMRYISAINTIVDGKLH
ncbi:hypothetical protein DBR43_30105 [Pedobacter sp. KBW06]|uniref:caspase family protein n=1 Tax=Pedobacter sp. KBW06 TaxID=2153359 RepID=UPI000F5A368A|nr:caspase family protein [Pedobacter sp. KBW06]RQO66463.1 hypothetical protein DBR43_30105 [Pedobacter sp. KBW06]